MKSRKGIYFKLKKEIKSISDNSAINYIKRPTFQMSGNREFFAEGKIYVDTYTDSNIVFSASGININITGSELLMSFYNKNLFKISGYIKDIQFI